MTPPPPPPGPVGSAKPSCAGKTISFSIVGQPNLAVGFLDTSADTLYPIELGQLETDVSEVIIHTSKRICVGCTPIYGIVYVYIERSMHTPGSVELAVGFLDTSADTLYPIELGQLETDVSEVCKPNYV